MCTFTRKIYTKPFLVFSSLTMMKVVVANLYSVKLCALNVYQIFYTLIIKKTLLHIKSIH